MNVAVINLRDILKYFFKILIAIFIVFFTMHYITNSKRNLKQMISTNVNGRFLKDCIQVTIPLLPSIKTSSKPEIKITNLIGMELPFFNSDVIEFSNNEINVANKNNTDNVDTEKTETQISTENQSITISPNVEIPKVAQTEEVTDRNFIPRTNTYYGTVKIDNQSDYTLTEDMLIPDVELSNKKDILIFHTHTCESYTPSQMYNYTMTGNYRTTDSNYNVVRVGTELTTYLTRERI